MCRQSGEAREERDEMTRLELILFIILSLAAVWWFDYTCGRDSAQMDYEMQMDIQEGAQK